MNDRIKSLLPGSVLAAALMVVPFSTAQSQQTVPMLTCPLGCGIVQSNTALAAQMARQGGFSILPAAQETPGFMYNIRVMAEENRWGTNVFGTEDTVLQAAFQGDRPEFERYLDERIPIEFKLLYGTGHVAQGKFFVTTDPDIESIDDMVGKDISLGLTTQSDWGMTAELILKHGYGIDHDNADIHNVTPQVLTQRLIDGQTDVAIAPMIGDTDGSEWWTGELVDRLEASGHDLYWIGVDQDAIDSMNEELNLTLITHEIPAGTLPQQDEDMLVGANRIYEAVHPDFPEEWAYELTMAAAEFGPGLREDGVGIWVTWSQNNMVAGLSEENVHPGAQRALEELGWWDIRHEYPPVLYPEGD